MAWPFEVNSSCRPSRRSPLYETLQARGACIGEKFGCFTKPDPEVVLLGRETIYRDGERVGWLSSAGWGYTVGANIGFGYVRNPGGIDRAYLESGRYELEVAGERVAFEWHPGPLYDPSMQKMKC